MVCGFVSLNVIAFLTLTSENCTLSCTNSQSSLPGISLFSVSTILPLCTGILFWLTVIVQLISWVLGS